MTFEGLEQRRTNLTCVKRNLAGLTENFEGLNVHKNYLSGLEKEEFCSGLDALAQTFRTLYTQMLNEPQNYAMKDDADGKGLAKNMNFLFLLAQKGSINNGFLEIDGKLLAPALKEASVTKPDMCFTIFESLGFTASGLGKKVETSEMIIVEFSDNQYLLVALKAMADAIGMFSRAKPHQQSSNYFELLDHRVLEEYPATEPKTSMEYIFSKIKGESRDVVEMFYEFIKPLAKCQIKGGIGHYWTPTFTLKSTKKVIMSIKINLESHDVKLNLANIGKYTELLDKLPEKMVDVFKDSGNCGNCNRKGLGKDCAFAFDLDGKSYRKCRELSFVFCWPDKNESELLLGLLKKELEFT